MQTFIIRRLLQIVLVLLVVTLLVFLMVRLLPGDPILMYMTAAEHGDLVPGTDRCHPP